MPLNRSFLLGAVLSFAVLLGGTAACLRWAALSGSGYLRIDPAGTMSSWVELEDRLRASFRSGEKPPTLLGDSVLGSGALMERRIPEARSNSLYHFLKGAATDGNRTFLSLASDGSLLPDVEGLANLASTYPLQEVLLLADPLAVLRPSFYPFAESADNFHLTPDGHLLMGLLLAHELIRVGQIPF